MRRNKDLLLAGVLAVVLSFVLFGNGIGGDFVMDDTVVIVGNPFIPAQLNNFWGIFTTPYFAHQPLPGLYRPMTIASYAINAFIFGSSPVGFHLANIFLHALTSFLIFVFVYRLSGKIPAFVSFSFFMFLPIHVEAVTSIVGRAEILSLLFVVGALIFVLQRRYVVASILFFLGLLSKEMAVAFIPIWLFLEFYQNKINIRSVAKKIWYFVPSVAAYTILRYIALGEYFLKNDTTFVYNPIKFVPFFEGLVTSFKVLFLYLGNVVYPVSLSSDYSFNQISNVKNLFSSFEAISGLVILCFLVLLFFKTKDTLIRLGIVIFLASYFVISNWVFKTGTIMADRLMYTPSFGLALIAGSIISRFSAKLKNRKVLYVFLSIILISYGFIIIDRNKAWLNEQNLFESAYSEAPDSIVNQTNKAYLDFIGGRYGEAQERLNKILSVAPEHVPALNLAGQNYKKLGQYKNAEDFWRKAIELRRDYLRAYLSLGVLYYENGYFKSAEKILSDSVNIYPRWSEVLFLALTKVSLDKPDEAIELINQNFGEDPLRRELKFALGWAYFNKGEVQIAHRYFDQVKDPNMSMSDFISTFKDSKVVILGEF